MLLLACHDHEGSSADHESTSPVGGLAKESDYDDGTGFYPENHEVWVDNESGLMWQREEGEQFTWEASVSYCNGLKQQGYEDWRLPTIVELRSLIRQCSKTEKGGPCPVSGSCLEFDCMDNNCNGCWPSVGPGTEGCYWPSLLLGNCKGETWSSSKLPEYDVDVLWIAFFDSASINTLPKEEIDNNPFYFKADVRCVRTMK